MPRKPDSRLSFPFLGALAITAAFMMAAVLPPESAEAHPAGACKPRIGKPANGATTSLEPLVTAKFGGLKNCKINEVQIIVREQPSNSLVFTKDWNCCNVMSSLHNVVEYRIPSGKLKPGREYKIQLMFKDKHLIGQPKRQYSAVTIRTPHQSGGYDGSGGGGDYASVEPNTNRPGSDYRDFTMVTIDPNKCAEVCEQDSKCRAYTYVPPGYQGPDPRCWLKDSVPNAVTAKGMVSGITNSPMPQTMNINRPGKDYTNFALNQPEPIRCAKACAGDSRCKAYTYVPPGQQGPQARCWLKDAEPLRKADDGLVSGVKE